MTTTKVGADIPSSDKKERSRKPKFDIATCTDTDGIVVARDEKGKLKGIPANVSRDFANLSKNDFSHVATYFEYKAAAMDFVIATATERKTEFLERAEEERSDKPSRKRQVKKVAKLKSQMEELMTLLEADGLSKEDLASMLAD